MSLATTRQVAQGYDRTGNATRKVSLDKPIDQITFVLYPLDSVA